MKARLQLRKDEYESAKKSFFHIYLLFINDVNIPKTFVDTVVKWGGQLDITDSEIRSVIKRRDQRVFETPKKEEAIDQLFDLVYMIYLDNVVEDVELEVAMYYASKLGFEPYVVGDLLKAIVAAPGDGIGHRQLKKDLKKLLLC